MLSGAVAAAPEKNLLTKRLEMGGILASKSENEQAKSPFPGGEGRHGKKP